MLQTQQKFSRKTLFLKAFWESIFLFLNFFKNIFIVDSIMSKRSLVYCSQQTLNSISCNLKMFLFCTLTTSKFVFWKKEICYGGLFFPHVPQLSVLSVLDNRDHRSFIQNRKLCIINRTLSLPCTTVAMKPLW